MKKKVTLLLSLLLGFAVYFIGFHETAVKPVVTEEKLSDPSSKMLPYDWMYAQRAYPNYQINKTAIREGIRHTKDAKAENADRQTGSWEVAGPINVGGRITDFAVHPTDQDILYAGTSVGGIFKSVNHGEDWEPIFDDANSLSIGDIALAPSNPDVLYVGTGEANGSATSGAFFGDGLYKTYDAGVTWEMIGLENTQHIGRIVVDPSNEDKVYVAATGLLYGKNDERGLYRTTDGGATWDQVLFVSDSTACIDVVINPQNANIVYAATWERIRAPWGRRYGGMTSRIYRSFDSGDNWEQLGNGLPEDSEQTGRIGLAISPSNPSILYASYTTNVVTNTFDGVYKSIDAGSSWERIDENEIDFVYSSFGWFFGNLRVHPTNPDDVSLLGVYALRSIDGGVNFADATFNMHVDFHALEYHPQNPDFMIAGNDGGIYLSENGGFTWEQVKTIPNNLLYNCEIDQLQPERIYAGHQDQGTRRTTTGAIDDFESILGADGFQTIVDPTDNSYVYAEIQFGRVFRSTNGGNSMECIFDCNLNNEPDPRTNWNTPIALHPDDPTVIYVGGNKLFKGEDRGDVFYSISEDLTDGQHPSGSLSYGTLTTIGLAPSDLLTIYTGSDDGNVNVTFDGGDSWTNISEGLPDRFVTAVAVHPEDPLTAYVTLSGYRETDYQPHILMTSDGGTNWEDRSANLPEIPINDVVIHPTIPNLLFIANDMGVWYSDSNGDFWELLGDNLPLTVVNDLDLHVEEKFILAATFGRSMLKYDISDLEPVSSEEISQHSGNINIYPNPSSGQSTLELNLEKATTASIQVLSLNGQLLQSKPGVQLTAGMNQENIDLSSLSTGNYIVRVKTTNGVWTSRITKVD